jgi:hypothetical protein
VEAIPIKPERKAELDDYAQRYGQSVTDALDEFWPRISSGNAPIIRRPFKASGRAMKT